MKRFLAIIAAALLLLTPVLAGPGRGGGGSSSSSRSSGSSSKPSAPSSPSKSYGSFSSKPSTPQATKPSGYGSFGNKAAQPVTARPQAQAAWARSQQATSAAASSKAELAKFKAPPTPAPAPAAVAASPVFSRTVTVTRPTYQTYVIQRQGYYSAYHPSPYVYSYAPRYGMWDAMFMWMMLDNMNSSMYYHHRNDADYMAWRADAERQAQNDAAVKAKLQQMDQKIKELEAQKTPVNPAYMPEGVDPSVAMAQDVAEQSLQHEQPAPNPDAVDWTQPRRVEETSYTWLWWLIGIGVAIAIGALIWTNRPRRSNGPYGF